MTATLLQFTDRNPATTGTIGAASGLLPSLLNALHLVSGVAGDLAAIFGCFASAITVALLIRAWHRDRDDRDRRNQVQHRLFRQQDLDPTDDLEL